MTAPSISQAITNAAQTLAEAGVAEPRREAGTLLGFVIGRDRGYLVINPNQTLTGEEVDRLAEAVRRRAAREPFQHIAGRQEFFGLEFIVTPDVLIPRSETELMVETALELIPDGARHDLVCDVGTGSGCIVIALLHERPMLQGIGLDISPPALAIAGRNAERLGVFDRLELRYSDGFDALSAVHEQFSLITSNPPYINETDYAGIQPEVRDHEPRIALTPGGDGLALVRRIIADAPAFLIPGGHLLVEIGYDQAAAVGDLVDASSWSHFEILPDLQGIPRCVVLRRA